MRTRHRSDLSKDPLTDHTTTKTFTHTALTVEDLFKHACRHVVFLMKGPRKRSSPAVCFPDLLLSASQISCSSSGGIQVLELKGFLDVLSDVDILDTSVLVGQAADGCQQGVVR